MAMVFHSIALFLFYLSAHAFAAPTFAAPTGVRPSAEMQPEETVRASESTKDELAECVQGGQDEGGTVHTPCEGFVSSGYCTQKKAFSMSVDCKQFVGYEGMSCGYEGDPFKCVTRTASNARTMSPPHPMPA